MLRVYACLSHDHDLRLVLVAGLICVLAAFTAFAAFGRAQAARRQRGSWVALAGLVAGVGIWATHFLAMLAYAPGLPIAYDVRLTLLSVLVAIAVCSLGWSLAFLRRPAAAPLAGAMIGIGVAAMHHLGMAAVIVQGRIVWDPILLASSLASGTLLGAGAVTLQSRRPRSRLAPALLALAVCCVHFLAMAAASLYPDPRIPAPASGVASVTLAAGVALAALLLLGIAFSLLFFDRRITRAELAETRHRAALADELIRGAAEREKLLEAVERHAAISAAALDNMHQGLSMYDAEDRLVIHNRRYAEIYGVPETLLVPGTPHSQLIEYLVAGSAARALQPDPAGPLTESGSMEVPLGDGRIVEIQRQPLPGGGWVATHEDITERKAASRRIAFLAAHDVLTGLPNRAAFGERLKAAAASASRRSFALHTIDLDRFKEVNDTLGHPVGDEILREAAARLNSVVGACDMVTRLGGDEFAILQLDHTGVADATRLAEAAIEALSMPFRFDGHTVVIGASAGISLAPEQGIDPDLLLKMSDLALYRAKSDSRGTCRIYEEGMEARLHERRRIETDLRTAIREGHFELHYQPLLDLGKGGIGCFEALIRWRHPERGLIQPADFIPIAEESGLIIPIGEWVLRQACRDAAGWPGEIRVAVNLSPAQFKRGDLLTMTTSALASAGLPPERLELEITESVLLHDEDWVRSVLEKLTSLGVRIAMDDFGTGYSSLSYLRSFPFTKIKIDGSFIADLAGASDALAIVQATIQLSEKLGMKTTAEGVETAEQLSILTSEGCSEVQGYHVSRPVPAGQVSGLLARYGQDQPLLRKAS